MAAPWIITETVISDASKRIPVYGLDLGGLVEMDFNQTSGAIPINARQHPIVGARWGGAKFVTDFAGSGTVGTAPNVDNWMKATGFKVTNNVGASQVYLADGNIGANFTAATLEAILGGGLTTICASAAADWTLTGTAGGILKASWTMFGTYTAPTEATNADSLATSAVPVPLVALVATIGGDTLVLKEFVIALNNKVNSPNYDMCNAAGAAGSRVVDQNPTFSFKAEFPALATANYFTDCTSGTKTTISIVVGTTGGNICTITGDAYPNRKPIITDNDGLAGVDMSYDFSFAAADTKLTITLT